MFVWIWLCAAIVFALLEAATVGLTSIWFAVGSVAALVAALLGAQEWLQFVLFAVVSAGALLLTRPLAKKYVNSQKKATNADRVLGMTGIVTEEINNVKCTGAVAVGGKEWSARSVNGEVIAAGVQVVPENIEGVKLMVKPAAEQTAAAGK